MSSLGFFTVLVPILEDVLEFTWSTYLTYLLNRVKMIHFMNQPIYYSFDPYKFIDFKNIYEYYIVKKIK